MQNHRFFKLLSLASGIVLLLFIMGLSVNAAWTPPTLAPPLGNVSEPINAGGSSQSKDGNLALNALNLFAYGLLVPFGNVGIGTATPASKLTVNGLIESLASGFKFPDGTIQTTAGGGGGSSQWTTSGTSIYYNTGNVGIGTALPSALLHLNFSPLGTALTPIALQITPTFGIDVTNQDLHGILITPNTNGNTDAGDGLNGIQVDPITGTAAGEDAIDIANAGWDMAINVDDGALIGLSTIGGRIEFDDLATDEVNILNAEVGIGTSAPQSALHVSDGQYAQFEDNNAGTPPAADCDNNAERGRMSIDTTNNRLYICNGATRGWDYIALTN